MRNNPVLSAAKNLSTLTTLYYPQSNGQNFDACKPARKLALDIIICEMHENYNRNHIIICVLVYGNHIFI